MVILKQAYPQGQSASSEAAAALLSDAEASRSRARPAVTAACAEADRCGGSSEAIRSSLEQEDKNQHLSAVPAAGAEEVRSGGSQEQAAAPAEADSSGSSGLAWRLLSDDALHRRFQALVTRGRRVNQEEGGRGPREQRESQLQRPRERATVAEARVRGPQLRPPPPPPPPPPRGPERRSRSRSEDNERSRGSIRPESPRGTAPRWRPHFRRSMQSKRRSRSRSPQRCSTRRRRQLHSRDEYAVADGDVEQAAQASANDAMRGAHFNCVVNLAVVSASAEVLLAERVRPVRFGSIVVNRIRFYLVTLSQRWRQNQIVSFQAWPYMYIFIYIYIYIYMLYLYT